MTVLEQHTELLEVVERAWSDGLFRDRLARNPRAVLAEAGFVVPENVSIVLGAATGSNEPLAESRGETICLTLPANPIPTEASDDEIDAIGVSPSAGSDVQDGCSQHPCCPYTKVN